MSAELLQFYYVISFSRLDLWLWQASGGAREMLIGAQHAEQREQSWLFCPVAKKKRENASRYYHEWSHTRIVTWCPDSVLQCLYSSMLMQHDRMSRSKPESTGGLICTILLSHSVTQLILYSPNVLILVSQCCKTVKKCHCFWLNVGFFAPFITPKTSFTRMI